MSNETSLTPEELQTEVLLGQCQPMAAAQCRDKLMFQAGRASAGRVHLWQGVSAVFSVLLLCSLMIRPVPPQTEPLTVTPQLASRARPFQSQLSETRDWDEQAYIRVRHRVLEQGLDALPDRPRVRTVASDRASYDRVLSSLMEL
ncbi:MAG: hypothetical protein GY809_23565 [Planctomycetes bacterium]|nr:hypothetical protein [Planctomycetota bacterium]